MIASLSPAWQRYFEGTAASRTTPPPAGTEAQLREPQASVREPGSRTRLWAQPGATRAPRSPAAGAPPYPTRPADQRPTPPEPPRRGTELAWLTWQMPAWLRDAARLNLDQTLDWRAQYCTALDEPDTPVGQTRFGLEGEELWEYGTQTLCKKLREELREVVRTLEAWQPRLTRNRRLAMHSARLGQLCNALEQRGQDALEEVRGGLEGLWV